jgi:Xaa-Pro dipeptidase
MKKLNYKSVSIFIVLLIMGMNISAQEARARHEILQSIRIEKFDWVLPDAMRDNGVDMWIHVMQDGHMDPLYMDLGVSIRLTVEDTMCYVIFTDKGKDGIERAIVGAGYDEIGNYDLWAAENDLGKFVAERNPKKIAVNMSEGVSVANGMSYVGYKRLTERIGKKYSDRLVSSERVITDFRTRRVQTEIITFGRLAETQRRLMEKNMRSIIPGKTTPEDFGWSVEDQLIEMGLQSGRMPQGPSWSAPSGRLSDDVYTRGDLIVWDWGMKYLNFETDIKRYAYILKEGETDLPNGYKKVWKAALDTREILRKTIKVGYTAGEMRTLIIKTLEKNGYVYTPSDDVSSQYRDLTKKLGDSEKIGFTIDCHTVGNSGNSEVAVGPSMAPFRDSRVSYKIHQNNLFAFEFVVSVWDPETKQRISLNLEDNAIVTEKGVEALYPRNEKIIIIR